MLLKNLYLWCINGAVKFHIQSIWIKVPELFKVPISCVYKKQPVESYEKL